MNAEGGEKGMMRKVDEINPCWRLRQQAASALTVLHISELKCFYPRVRM